MVVVDPRAPKSPCHPDILQLRAGPLPEALPLHELLQLGLVLVALSCQMLLPVKHLLVPLLVHPCVVLDFVKLMGKFIQLGLDTNTSMAVDWEVGAGRADGGLSAGARG